MIFCDKRIFNGKLKLDKIFLFLQVEAGDVILKINGTDVHRFSTKEGKYVSHLNPFL